MKKSVVSAALLMVVLAVRPARADTLPPPTIVSTGTAEVRVKPDLADLSFTVATRQADLAKAHTEQAARAVKVLNALHAIGVGDADLQTSQVSVSTHYARNGDHDDTATVSYYNVAQTISCTLHDVNKVGDVTTAVLLAGANEVGGASLRTSDLRKYRDQARVQAARSAREKAGAIAEELGVKVGKPYGIVESNDLNASYSVNNNSMTTAGGGRSGESEESPTFAPGTISVTSSVQVTFLLDIN